MEATPIHAFFLGGYDLEMLTICGLLAQHVPAPQVYDRHLSWGARAVDYEDILAVCPRRSETPVLVELGGAEEWLRANGIPGVVVDHHGERAGPDRPSSLRQVFDLLQRPAAEWTRWFALVEANDRGHLRAMQELGATTAEMRDIRARDRAAQGVTPIEEAQGLAAIKRAMVLFGGRLTVVDIPHNRTTAVADAMEPLLGGPGYQNLLIMARNECDFFGAGSSVEQLHARFGGWKGGMLPKRGFWGIDEALKLDDLCSCIEAGLT